MLRFRNETLSWGSHVVLAGLDLEIAAGERMVLLGRSGAGKSTLLAAAYRRLSEGHRVALVPQEHGLVPQLSVFHNVFMGRLDDHGSFYNLANLAWPRRSERNRVAEILSNVGLEGTARTAVERLSGGQKQRTALARGLNRGGDVIIADEPVSAVDERQAADLLDRVATRFPTSLVALHDVDLARRFASRLIGIREGRIVLDAAPGSVSEADLRALYRG